MQELVTCILLPLGKLFLGLFKLIKERPLFGRLNFNSFFVTPFAGDVQLERDITLVLHELTHVLGFSEGLMDYYINPITNAKLTGHRMYDSEPLIFLCY